MLDESAYAARLKRLVLPEDPILPMLENIAMERGWWPAGLDWKRSYERFDPGEHPYCTFIYETRGAPQHIAVARLNDDMPAADSDQIAVLAAPELGWIEIDAFPNDARLTGIANVLSGNKDAHVARYRSGKRCTIRTTQPDGRILFAKVFSDDRGARVHRDGMALWRSADSGELDFAVAEPVRWDPTNNVLWQTAVAGTPLKRALRGRGGRSLANAIGRAAASLTGSSLKPQFRFDGADQQERTDRYAEELTERMPESTPVLRALLKKLRELHTGHSVDRHRPIHGSPHVHQWLLADGRLGLVDFDRLSLGDPELDAATFIAELDFSNPAKWPVRDLNAAFIAGYESCAGSLNPDLLLAYRVHKYVAKALKAARAVRPDAKRRALRNLRRAGDRIESGLT